MRALWRSSATSCRWTLAGTRIRWYQESIGFVRHTNIVSHVLVHSFRSFKKRWTPTTGKMQHTLNSTFGAMRSGLGTTHMTAPSAFYVVSAGSECITIEMAVFACLLTRLDCVGWLPHPHRVGMCNLQCQSGRPFFTISKQTPMSESSLGYKQSTSSPTLLPLFEST